MAPSKYGHAVCECIFANVCFARILLMKRGSPFRCLLHLVTCSTDYVINDRHELLSVSSSSTTTSIRQLLHLRSCHHGFWTNFKNHGVPFHFVFDKSVKPKPFQPFQTTDYLYLNLSHFLSIFNRTLQEVEFFLVLWAIKPKMSDLHFK